MGYEYDVHCTRCREVEQYFDMWFIAIMLLCWQPFVMYVLLRRPFIFTTSVENDHFLYCRLLHNTLCSSLTQSKAIIACTRAHSLTRPCPCATCNWLLHPAPTIVTKMVLTLCNLHCWWFSCKKLIQRLMVFITCNLCWWFSCKKLMQRLMVFITCNLQWW